MKYKIAICDDYDVDRQYILNMVTLWGERSGHIVHIDTFSSAENFLFHYAEESDYDILLLDIEMGEMDGVTMAKKLRKIFVFLGCAHGLRNCTTRQWELILHFKRRRRAYTSGQRL